MPVYHVQASTYRAIRKTVMTIRLDESDSFRAVSRSGGHLGSGVMMPHHLNAPPIVAELDRSVRRFQDAIQSLMTRNLNQAAVAEALGITTDSLAQMRRHAERAGIAAALGLVKDNGDAGAEHMVVKFSGGDEANLAALYLAYGALQELRRRTRNHARYKVRFLPMLAMAKAIGRQLFANGYARRYRKAARAAAMDLREGRTVLPFLGE